MPIGAVSGIFDYAKLCQDMSGMLKQVGRNLLKMAFEKMDYMFRISPGRTDRYYVKNCRTRTIVAIFGPVTYKRTEYTDRSTNENYIYVDEKLNLHRRMRYDAVICSMAADLYSDQNSMIKVGKILGEMINGYTLDGDHSRTAISRQQIFYMLNRVKGIRVRPERCQETPEVLYIMADEKYIPLQYHTPAKEGENRPRKRMNKVAVAFTGRTRKVTKNGEFYDRWELTDKYIFSYPDGSFWAHVAEDLSYRYDMSKVKMVYILGDGASWIKNGTDEFITADTKARFALDRFHFGQALFRISKDKEVYKTLYNYAIHNSRKDFKMLCESLINADPSKADTIQKNENYALDHLTDMKVMNSEVKIGCAMEQVISHIIASVFISVPKAYADKHLGTYIDNRINHENKLNVRELYLKALNLMDSKGIAYINKDKLDLSMFDGAPETYSYRDPNRSRNHRVG